MTIPDWLEKYVCDGFKRELDFEEAVWRSLQPLVTTSGFLVGLIGYLLLHISRSPSDLARQSALFLTLVGVASTARAFWHLREAVKKRRHRYPPDELQVVSDVEAAGAGSALDGMRLTLLRETAAAASHNHPINAQKMTARTHAANWLFLSSMIALIACSIIAVAGQSQSETQSHGGQASLSTSSPASSPTTTASPAVGREREHQPAEAPIAIGTAPSEPTAKSAND